MSLHLPSNLYGMLAQKLSILKAIPLVSLLGLFVFFPASVGIASPNTHNKPKAASQPTHLIKALPLQTFQWEKRLVLLFAPSPTHKIFKKQLALLLKNQRGLKERHILVIQLFGRGQSKVGKRLVAKTVAISYRRQLKLSKKSYTFILIGKDGGVKLRKNELVQKKELFGLIDSMPMRQQEMKQQAQKGNKTL